MHLLPGVCVAQLAATRTAQRGPCHQRRGMLGVDGSCCANQRGREERGPEGGQKQQTHGQRRLKRGAPGKC